MRREAESAGAAVLLVAAVLALGWANSPWQDGYVELWSGSAALGHDVLPQDVRHWVNDGLMAVFFFVVGLEIRRELATGQLSARRDAALPVFAALGGMALPALIYAVINLGGDGGAGWGIPMATDIAFAVGVLALFGDRVPAALKLVLLALAIVDDVGAIVVIAVFYADDVSFVWLGAAAAVAAAAMAWSRRAPRSFPLWLVPIVGVALWAATFESGVHATIAGVALAFAVPAVSVERLERALDPWSSLVVLPLFALANAGVVLSSDAVSDAAGSAVTLGIALGLVVGKPVGVGLAVWLAVRLGWCRLPAGVGWRGLAGVAAVAGIGFTVSLFVAGLAFDDPALVRQATIGVLAGSAIAAAGGAVLIARGAGAIGPDTDVR